MKGEPVICTSDHVPVVQEEKFIYKSPKMQISPSL